MDSRMSRTLAAAQPPVGTTAAIGRTSSKAVGGRIEFGILRVDFGGDHEYRV